LGQSNVLLAVELDVTGRGDAAAAVRAAVDRFRRIDVLVNNAVSFGVRPGTDPGRVPGRTRGDGPGIDPRGPTRDRPAATDPRGIIPSRRACDHTSSNHLTGTSPVVRQFAQPKTAYADPNRNEGSRRVHNHQ
jgi:NAD(P)-dependent dehydrogenase (short-subunit alcohol dehydrogenase family)